MVDFSQLNANQLEAVHWDEGHLLVLAGPGSGKTQVLIYRIARIIEATAGEYFRVLGLTYTHAAAAEMLKRIELLVSNARERILLTTFHAFCAAILRQHGHHIGLQPDFVILTQPEERQDILEEAVVAARECSPDMEYNSERLLSIVTHLLDRNVKEDEALEFLIQRYGVRAPRVVSSVYASYRRLMLERNVLDFGVLISDALRLFQLRPDVARLTRSIYPLVCVDDFQDVNIAQYRIENPCRRADKEPVRRSRRHPATLSAERCRPRTNQRSPKGFRHDGNSTSRKLSLSARHHQHSQQPYH